MRILLALIVIWLIGFIWLVPKTFSGTELVGKKLEEIKQDLMVTPPPAEKILAPNQDSVAVARVIDGDTFEITGGVSVRIIGVNTPETVDPRRPVQCFGTEAKDFSHQMLDGKTIRLEKDISETDKYGRLLRYVYVKNADGSETFFNLALVAEGYAESSSYPPDIKHQPEFVAAQNKAILDNKGLWGKCGSIPHGTTVKKKV